MFIKENHVETAVKAAGGPTYTSNQLGVSNACVYRWINTGRVPKIEMAKKLAELSRISVEKLRAV